MATLLDTAGNALRDTDGNYLQDTTAAPAPTGGGAPIIGSAIVRSIAHSGASGVVGSPIVRGIQ